MFNGRVFTIMADFPQNFRFNHASQIAWRKSEFRIAKIIADVAALIGENDAVFTKMPVCRQIGTVWPIGSSLGLLPVAAALHQVFHIGFFEQAHQLGFLAGQQNIFNFQRLRIGHAALQYDERNAGVAVRAALVFPKYGFEYGIAGRVAFQFQRFHLVDFARVAFFAQPLRIGFVGIFHTVVSVQFGLNGTLCRQAAVELFPDPVVQMPVARYRISHFGFVADGFVFPVFAVAGFGFKLDGAEG